MIKPIIHKILLSNKVNFLRQGADWPATCAINKYLFIAQNQFHFFANQPKLPVLQPIVHNRHFVSLE